MDKTTTLIYKIIIYVINVIIGFLYKRTAVNTAVLYVYSTVTFVVTVLYIPFSKTVYVIIASPTL